MSSIYTNRQKKLHTIDLSFFGLFMHNIFHKSERKNIIDSLFYLKTLIWRIKISFWLQLNPESKVSVKSENHRSVVGVVSSRCNDCVAPTPHGEDVVPHRLLGDVLPGCLEGVRQLLDVLHWSRKTSNVTIKGIPQMFDGV